jgi:glucose/arabinose dehydrogenase
MVVGSLGSVWAIDQPAGPGGAPDPKRGPFQPTGFVRVVDGDSLEMLIDGRRVAVGVLGIDAAPFGTPCGGAARAELQSLVGKGVALEDDPANILDTRKRRMYKVTMPDGRSVAAALVADGLAKATGRGPEAATLAALESQARQTKAGCVWGGPVPTPLPATGAGSKPGTIPSTGPRPSQGQGSASTQAAGSVLPSFADDTVVSGLSFPTGFAFLPDGRVLVAEKEGRVRLVANGQLQPTPVLDIQSRVNSYWDRGILGIAPDPAFATNGYFYVFATYENDASNVTGPKTSQVLRYTLGANNIADPASATVILGSVTGAGCPDPSSNADCLPAEGSSHSGGSLRFGSDGYLYVSTGDAASFTAVDPLALRAQDVNSQAGKILRITASGQGVNGNPFWDGNASHPRSKVWALGFRNPFRIVLRPGTSMPFVGDVGWSTWEEVDVVPAGSNAGWPCYEGNHVQDGYASSPVCSSLYGAGPSAVLAPLTEWPHNGGGGAAMAGTFYTGSVFPSTYQGALLYSDYARGWVRSVAVDSNNQLASASAQFAGGQNGLVQMETGPDGALWYVAIGSGELRRIYYTVRYTPIQCPDGQFRAEYFPSLDLSGVPVQRCETSVQYTGGSPVDGIGPEYFSARWTGRFPFGNDSYTFSTTSDDGSRIRVDNELILDDWHDGAANTVTVDKVMTAGDHTVAVEYYQGCCEAEMHAGWQGLHPNTAPVPSIASPAAGATFKVGDVIQLQGSASDAQDVTIPASSLRWDVIQMHCPGFGTECHQHPLLTLAGSAAQFTAPDHGDGSYFLIKFTATDSQGTTATATQQVDPKTLQVTLATSPSGGTVVYDGTSHTAPYTATTIAGSTHSIEVTPAAGQIFGGWSQGGAARQNVTVGEQDVTYTAMLGSPTTPPTPTPTPSPTTTPSPSPTPSACSPRPRVVLTIRPGPNGGRVVEVATSTNPGTTPNTLKSIQFQESTLAILDVPRYPSGPAPITATYAPGTFHTFFTIRRSAPGAMMVRFTVVDDCGAWPTFIGAGATAGW